MPKVLQFSTNPAQAKKTTRTNRIGSAVHPELNDPDMHWSEEIVRRDFPGADPATGPYIVSEHAGREVRAFADAFAVDEEDVVDQAVKFWFDHHGGRAILEEEKVQEWLAVDPRRTRAGYFRKALKKFASK